MTKEETDKLEKNLAQVEEPLSREKKHLQVLSEAYGRASRATLDCLAEMIFLFRESSDWAYYQNLTVQHGEQERQFQRDLQDRIDDHAYRQRQLEQQRVELKERLKGKGEY